MMTDIVERLRVWPAGYGEDTLSSTVVGKIMKDAADEIERLRNDAQSARTGGLDMHTVTESIYSGSNVIVALADVQHIEKWDKHTIPGVMVVTSHTKWNFEHDAWENGIWISEPEATAFKAAWCRYRSELETDTLMDLSPSLPSAQRGHPHGEVK